MTHKVTTFGRWTYLVSSASREGLFHLVDLEPSLLDDGTPDPKGRPFQCSCESDLFAVERPCRHVRAVIRHIRPILEHLSKITSSYDTKATKRQYKLKP